MSAEVRLLYHAEDGGWWAESPDLAGFSAAGNTYAICRRLAHRGVALHYGGRELPAMRDEFPDLGTAAQAAASLEEDGENRFGFEVRRIAKESWWEEQPNGFKDFVTRTYDPPHWSVYLPHQCNEWDITGEDPVRSAPHDLAVADLEEFIAEAQRALAALRAQREIEL